MTNASKQSHSLKGQHGSGQIDTLGTQTQDRKRQCPMVSSPHDLSLTQVRCGVSVIGGPASASLS